MFRPTGDLVFVVPIQNKSGHLVLPDNVDPVKGDVFQVTDIGQGYYDNGVLIKSELQVGDRVCIAGKMLKLPIQGLKIYCARSGDIIAYERKE